MELNLINNIIQILTGAGISLSTTYFVSKNQVKRDKVKFENESKIKKEKREFEEISSNKKNILENIEKICGLLSYFEHSISLTSSVIDSSNKMNPEEFDKFYKKELKQLTKLKSLIVSRFPNLYNNIQIIDNHHNNYWGNQRLLLQLDIKSEKEDYLIIQKKIIEITYKTRSEINELITELKKISKDINNLNK